MGWTGRSHQQELKTFNTQKKNSHAASFLCVARSHARNEMIAVATAPDHELETFVSAITRKAKIVLRSWKSCRDTSLPHTC